MTDQIVDYVEIVKDKNGKYRVRGLSDNGEIIWTSEQYDTFNWAQKVAEDSGKEIRDSTFSEPIDVDETEATGRNRVNRNSRMNTKPRYAVIPGWIRSKYDGELHYIDAPTLMSLYRVKPSECIVSSPSRNTEGLIMLRPRYNGVYNVPK